MLMANSEKTCEWCRRSFPPSQCEEKNNTVVCLKCYRLLIGAKISLNEIFAKFPSYQKHKKSKPN